eukprot:jgi/Botrbrau1/1500/Bobra.178_3s0053.1
MGPSRAMRRPGCAVIVNPTGGSGRCGRWFGSVEKELCSVLQDLTGTCHVYITENFQQVSNVARSASEAGTGLIIAVGGDGTLSGVVHGIMTSECLRRAEERPHLSCIPAGTASDFCRTLGLDTNWHELCDKIRCGKLLLLDVGFLQCTSSTGQEVKRYFLNEASCGLAARTIYCLAPVKKFGAWLGYMLATAIAFVGFQPYNCRLRLDTENWIALPSMSLAYMGNGKYGGGGMKLAPDADPCDGLLSVIILERAGIFRFLRYVFSIRSGRYAGTGPGRMPGCTCYRSREVFLEPMNQGMCPPAMVEADGELQGQLPASFKVLQGAIHFVA